VQWREFNSLWVVIKLIANNRNFTKVPLFLASSSISMDFFMWSLKYLPNVQISIIEAELFWTLDAHKISQEAINCIVFIYDINNSLNTSIDHLAVSKSRIGEWLVLTYEHKQSYSEF